VGTPIRGWCQGGSDIRGWDVVASGPVVLPPLSQGIVVGKMRGTSNSDVPREVLVEPVGIGKPGAYVARVASRVYTQEELVTLGDLEGRSERKTCTRREKYNGEVNANDVSIDGKELSLQASASNAARYYALKVLNTSRQHLEIGKHVKLGTAEAILRCAPRVTEFDWRNLEAGSVNLIRRNDSAELAEVRAELERRLAHLVTVERQILMPIMNEYLDLFCNDKEGVPPCTTKGFHEIMIGDALPYRVPYALREEMKNQLDEMLRKEVITPCASPWAAPVILVPKKAADGTPKYRFYTNFRGLNSVTSIPVYPIPDIKSNLSPMAGSKYFTLLDIENTYLNIPIKEEHKDKTGLVTPFRSFRYEKMAFGLADAPATF
jgi:hypothetical protein